MRVSTSKHDGISMPKKDGEVGILSFKAVLRTSKNDDGDAVIVCRQPIKLLYFLFARTNSPDGKQALEQGFYAASGISNM